MQINSNFNAGGTDPVLAKRTVTPSAKATSPDTASFSGASALDQALAAVPNSRPDAVARAKQLIADPNYPSADTIKQLSNFLASKLISSATTAD